MASTVLVRVANELSAVFSKTAVFTPRRFLLKKITLFGSRFRVILPKETTRTKSAGVNLRQPIPFFAAGILATLGLRKDDDEDEMITIIKRAILNVQEKDFSKAERMLHIALRVAQEKQNQDGITYIYDMLANIAYEQEEYTKAEKIFIDIMKRLISAGTPKNDNAIVHISLKLASLYSTLDQDVKADAGFRFCIDSQQEKIDAGASDEDTLLLWAMSVDWYARYLLKHKKYKEAEIYFKKAYDMSIKVLGANPEQTAVLLNDLGTVCSLRGNFNAALEYLEKAIELGEKIKTPDLPSFYVNLGTVYMQKGLLTDANKACEQGKREAQRLKNKEAEEEASECLLEIKKNKLLNIVHITAAK